MGNTGSGLSSKPDRKYQSKSVGRGFGTTPGDYVLAVVAVGAATPLQFLVAGLTGLSLPFLSYLGAVLIGAWRGGMGPGLVATVTSALTAAYFFIPPSYSLAIGGAKCFAVLFFSLQGVLVSVLCEGRLRAESALAETVERLIEERDARTRLLEDERAAREDAERARREAQNANRVKDEFLAILSHELRTPLNPIIGWTQLLRRGNLAPARQASALEVIERNAKLQNQLIGDLLDVSRIQQGKFYCEMKKIDLVPVVWAAVEAVHNQAESAGVTLHTFLPEHQVSSHADPLRMQQVVWNLLVNAIKFTPRGGRVEVSLTRQDGLATLTVQDTGMGIAPAFLPHLFERFRQADSTNTRKHGGLGLGLFIVRHIVENHGGRVRVESAGLRKGATFTVELPSGVAPSPVSFSRE